MAESEEVLIATSNLYQTYECLGVVFAEAHTGNINRQPNMLKGMKDLTDDLAAKAKEMGGDAVIGIQFDHRIIVEKSLIGNGERAHIWGMGTAIRRHIAE